ncbi:nitrogen regulation protein NR(II) [Castellaniella sp. GW247-6E4]|uniref:nitrogen regulation protein NR(II) n=1 Tax=Castellaniella sp. GW247-6E4 TaxID=3140380 RepID=UPI003314A48F
MDPSGYDLLKTAVLLLDGGLRIRHANTAAEEHFGLSRRQLEGMEAARLIDGAQSVVKVPLRGAPWAWLYEIPVRTAVLDDRQHIHADQAAQRESLRNLAHEIRNPLSGLRAAAQLLEGELDDPGLKDYTGVIIAEADRLVDLVERLVSSQRQGLEVRCFNIHEVCERVYTLLAAEHGRRIEIVRDYDASAPEVRADFSRVLQALLNVARNAGQALAEQPQNPAPRLVLRTRVGHQLVLPRRQVRMGLVLSVVDNGPGVPEALRDKIFHPLLTGRAQGTGLGLSLAQEFMQQHGGLVEFDSRPGHTEFRLILPMEPL